MHKTWLSLLSPEASFLCGYLTLSIKLICGGCSHENVDDHQVVVDRVDLCGISGPYETSGGYCDLLVHRDVLGWLREVADIGDGDHPLEGGGPEENGEGACGVEQQGAGTTGPGHAHYYVLDCWYYSESHSLIYYLLKVKYYSFQDN